MANFPIVIGPTRPIYNKITEDHIGPLTFTANSQTYAATVIRPSRIDTPEGFISSDRMHYYVKDYQGNVRQVTNADGAVVQDNHYYPYGMLMGESSNIIADARGYCDLSFNPYLYGSKEYITTAGANILDFTARMYDPSTLLFQTQDPLLDKFHPFNTYSYCGGDPVNRIDPEGMDIAVLLVDGNIGHMGLLISTENGKWLYYSVNGDNFTSSGIFSGGKRFNEVGIDGGWSSPQDFLDSEFNTKPEEEGDYDHNHANYNYTKAYEIKTTQEQDKIIAETFTKIADEEYNLFSNNCAHAVQRSLEEGGIKVSQEVSSMFIQTSLSGYTSMYVTFPPYRPKRIRPENAFHSIIKQNPNGQLYKKSNN